MVVGRLWLSVWSAFLNTCLQCSADYKASTVAYFMISEVQMALEKVLSLSV